MAKGEFGPESPERVFMKPLGKFDSESQMYTESFGPPNLDRWKFLRWMGLEGKLEHDVYGPQGGAYASAVSPSPEVITTGLARLSGGVLVKTRVVVSPGRFWGK